MNLKETLEKIVPLDQESVEESLAKWDNLAKPLRSLGSLEKTVAKISGIQRTPKVNIDKRGLIIMCADNGVTKKKITQTDPIVTAIMSENFVKGTTTVCTMAKYNKVDVFPVDIGIDSSMKVEGLFDKKIMRGTNDISEGPAMTYEDAIKAIEIGIEMASLLKEKGYNLILTGEMGIGNTTTSSSVASVLLDISPEKITGRGAGLDDEGLNRKINAIKKAIEVNKPDKNDPIDVVSKVGGLDIAGMTGVFLGSAAMGIPVMIDGFISGVSALLASKICPLSKDYMITSHVSAEPGGKYVLENLDLVPILTASMCLGEGTGAVAALPVIDTAIYSYYNTITFAEINIEDYIYFR